MKVELIAAPGISGEKRYKVRVNGRDAVRHPEASLTEVFDRLRRWIVRRA